MLKKQSKTNYKIQNKKKYLYISVNINGIKSLMSKSNKETCLIKT